MALHIDWLTIERQQIIAFIVASTGFLSLIINWIITGDGDIAVLGLCAGLMSAPKIGEAIVRKDDGKDE